MNKMNVTIVVALLIFFNVAISLTAFAGEQLSITENNSTEKISFQSKFINPDIYIPSFDTNESTFQKSSVLIEFKGSTPSLKTSKERSEFLNKLDATRLDVRKEMVQYLYPKGPIIGYGWSINGSFYVTYHENASIEKNTTIEVYSLIQEKAEIWGIENVPVKFQSSDILKTASTSEVSTAETTGYDMYKRPLVGGLIVTSESSDYPYYETSTLGFNAINSDNYDKGCILAWHAAKDEGLRVNQPYWTDEPDDEYTLGTVDIIPGGVLGIDAFIADASFVENDRFSVSPQIHIGSGVLKEVYGYEEYPDVGTIVYKSGFVTGETEGIVDSVGAEVVDFDDYFVLYNQTIASYYSERGDSGSPVYTKTPNGNIYIVGIHSGRRNLFSDSVFSPVSGIEEELGVVPYTTWHTDWTPYNDPESDGDTLTTTSELQHTIYCWLYDEPTPKTSEMVPTPRLQQTIGDWLVSKSPGGGGEVVANRTISSYNVTPNSTFTIMVNITPDQYTKGIALDEDYPDGWNITSVDDNNGTFKNSTVEWIWTSAMSGGETCTVTYNATVPGNITGGIYNMTGFTSACDVNSTEIGGDYEVYVMDDWNPWNDYDSEDGRYISRVEMQSTLIMWQTQIPVPRTGELITRQQMQYLLLCWKKQIPCY